VSPHHGPPPQQERQYAGRVRSRLEARQVQANRCFPAGRHQPLKTQAQGRHIACQGQLHRLARQPLRLAAQQRQGGCFEQVQRAGDAEATIHLASSLYSLLRNAGKPRLLERVGQVCDAAAAALGETWNHARFAVQRARVEQQFYGGRLREALDGAQALLQRARLAGEKAYPAADYDLAYACSLLARVLNITGGSEQALPLLDEAGKCFEAVANERASKTAEGMVSHCITGRADCLRELGRLDEAAAAYEEAIRRESNKVTTGASPSEKPSLGACAWHSSATNRHWRLTGKRVSGSRGWTNPAPSP
jgi:tetratricopeptide (TPR) repeat protein